MDLQGDNTTRMDNRGYESFTLYLSQNEQFRQFDITNKFLNNIRTWNNPFFLVFLDETNFIWKFLNIHCTTRLIHLTLP